MNPKIALVCDWLTTPGGAEKVLLELHHMYPDAPIYTSQYNPKGITWFRDADVRTGWLQIFPAALRKILGPLRQLYFSHLDLSDYDLVISVTGAEAKSIKAQKHLCYCHVPTQYYWQMFDSYVENPGFGPLNPFVRACFKLLVKPLRKADFKSAQRPTQFITISSYSTAQIQQYYHRDAVVIAPPVEIAKFATRESRKKSPLSKLAERPFVISCRQVTWKRVDLAIQACLEAKQPLLVIGDGPEHKNLVKLANNSPLITFIPWLDSSDLAFHLQNSRAYLFPSLEPFGIAAVEALAAGCSVIAYAEGGSRDFVHTSGRHKNGLLFSEQTSGSLAKAIKSFNLAKFDRATIQASAAQFSPEIFQQKVTQLVNQTLKEPKS